jgi:methylthioribose-1-phosphate isomerase
VRGAPLIGVAAAYGLALELQRPNGLGLEAARELLGSTRPTAVNLVHALARVSAAASPLAEAEAIEREEVRASAAMAAHGADCLAGTRTALTHCNTGFLAAPGRGTALAVIAELHDRGDLRRAIVTETRPLLQGARLTTYELSRLGIPYELIVDSAAAGIIAAGQVDAVVVGCDRVAANGDVANKVGTYGLALAAAAAQIPFVVVGPSSTVDPACPSGAEIVIEERDPAEVRDGTPCRNPAFDVTPSELVTTLVTEQGARTRA